MDFATGIAEFLCGLGIEGLVVACNTASAVALPALAERCPVPVWGVIDPGVEAAARVARSGLRGGDRHQGDDRQRSLPAPHRSARDAGLGPACPMLVHVVEEGLADSPEAELLVRHYLEGRPAIDALILGCTHYPLLRTVIQRVAGPEVALVDSAEVTAECVRAAFGAAPGCFAPGRVVHFVTGDPVAFAHTARVIGGVEGEIVSLPVSELAAASA